MDDYATKATDRAIESLEKRITKVYTQAQCDVQAKMDDFVSKFKAKDVIKRKQLADGEITQSDYNSWVNGQVFQGKRWKAQLDDLTETLTRADVLARSIINNSSAAVFAENANWTAYTIEKAGNVSTGFGLYDAQTVTRLLRDQPNLLPRKVLNVAKDKAWNQKKITQRMAQGVLQGEALDKVAKRLRNVAEMDRNQSLTHARTAMTGAQNAGRQETYARAEKMGIEVHKEWVATLDHHTRVQHAALDGQSVPVDQPFHVGGYSIMYPGDPNAAPSMTYNCRCTTVAKTIKYPNRNAKRYDNEDGKPIEDMSYQQWSKSKSSNPYEANTNKYTKVSMTPDDWELWAVDPEPFQDALLHGTKTTNAGWGTVSKADQDRIINTSQQIQIEACTHRYKDIVTTYRGESYGTLEEAKSVYQNGAKIVNTKLTSNATKKSIAMEYAEMNDGVNVLQVITNRGGIRGIMTDPMGVGGSDGIIAPVGNSYKVTSVDWKSDSNTLIVYMFASEDNKKLSKSAAEELLEFVKQGGFAGA